MIKSSYICITELETPQPVKQDYCNAEIAQCRQKLDSFLFSNKIYLKLKSSINVFHKKCGPKLILFNEKTNIWTFFDIEN